MKTLGAVFLLAGSVAAQEFDRNKHPWAKWKAGSYVEYKVAQEAGGQKMDLKMKQQLLEVTQEGYKTVTTTAFGGQEQKQEESGTIPKKTGEEKVTVEGKEYDCIVWTSQHTEGAKKSTNKIWTIKGRDLPVKIVSSGDEEVEMLATSLSDKVTAGGKVLECVTMKGSMKTPQGKVEITAWMNMDVPGAIVQMKMSAPTGKVEITATTWEGKR